MNAARNLLFAGTVLALAACSDQGSTAAAGGRRRPRPCSPPAPATASTAQYMVLKEGRQPALGGRDRRGRPGATCTTAALQRLQPRR